MIKNLTSSSEYLTVQGYDPAEIYGGALSAGQVRYNPNNQQMEVYDGANWYSITNGVTVGLSWDADNAIRWAIEKQKEEQELKDKMDKYPALKDAYEQLEMVKALVYGELDEQK